MSAAVARGPIAAASRASGSAGKRATSGASKVIAGCSRRSSRGAGPDVRPGHVRAYGMGMRMSGDPSWATTDVAMRLPPNLI